MDPISDLLVRIRNGYRVRRPTVLVPYSRFKGEIVRVLGERGYVGGVERRGRRVRKTLEISLRYKDGEPAFRGAKRLSKSSRRVYVKAGSIRPVLQGTGMLILSTPQGVMTGEEARKARVGGEAIAEVW